MFNMFSPYQQRLAGILPITYCEVEVKILNQKIEYMTNLKRVLTEHQKELLNLHITNREFIIRQLNQQMLESHD